MDLFKEYIDKNINFVLIGLALIVLGIIIKWLYNQILKL